MNTIRNTFAALSVMGLALLLAPAVSAQEWSAAQKEVWKNVEAYAELYNTGKTDAFMAYFHPDYVGWYSQSPTPGNKESARKFIAYDHKTTKTQVYDAHPLSIKLHGDVAIVHYYYTSIGKDADGKEKAESGRWTDILMKQGDKWVLIGDHGGPSSKN